MRRHNEPSSAAVPRDMMLLVSNELPGELYVWLLLWERVHTPRTALYIMRTSPPVYICVI